LEKTKNLGELCDGLNAEAETYDQSVTDLMQVIDRMKQKIGDHLETLKEPEPEIEE
jgi:hypothetical protein